LTAFKHTVLAVYFLLELVSFVAFGYWGFHMNSVGTAAKIVIGLGAPLGIAILWGLFLSPKASLPVISMPVRPLFKLLVFALAAAALYASGQRSPSAVLLAAALLETVLLYALGLAKAS
jgi:hypothetical protein